MTFWQGFVLGRLTKRSKRRHCSSDSDSDDTIGTLLGVLIAIAIAYVALWAFLATVPVIIIALIVTWFKTRNRCAVKEAFFATLAAAGVVVLAVVLDWFFWLLLTSWPNFMWICILIVSGAGLFFAWCFLSYIPTLWRTIKQ